VSLKKPSELFNQKSSLDTVQEQLMNAEPQKIENITGALRLLGHPAFTSSTTFKTIFTAIESS
jgi:hypothetical protein